MKGIAHFVTGVAVASFFPEIVYGASQNLTFGPVLGGLAGLLPDTLDFKFVRYFDGLENEIDPAQNLTEKGRPDPQAVAEKIAAAMNKAHRRCKRVKVQLHTVRLGSNLWQQWSVAFDQVQNEVIVRIGPLVTTGLVPIAGSNRSSVSQGRARVDADILPTYDAEIKIDIFSGPSLAFERVDDAVEVTFLPWHRSWTHSLFMALLLGGLGWLVAPVYGGVMAIAVLAHTLQDQMGFMGNNFLYPFTRKRTMGLGLIRSGDAVPNFLVVWVGLAVILLNLDRFSDASIIPVLPYVLVVIVLPCCILLGLSAWDSLRAKRQPAEALQRIEHSAMAAVEALDETDEVDI